MNLFEVIALLITLAAVFSYINFSYLRLPTTIGVMLISLLLSLLLVILRGFGPDFTQYARQILDQIDFNKTLLPAH